MKKRVIFSIGVAALLCGCYNEEPAGGIIEGAQEFVATTAVGRVSVESGENAPVLKWEEADQVGIFDRTNDPKRNYCYDANLVEGSQDVVLVANDAQRVYYSVKGEPSTFYAYAPYNEEANTEAQNFSISLPRAQFQKRAGDMSHLKDVNFMMAQPLTVESGAANLCFESVFAFVKLDVSLADNKTVPVKQVRIKSSSANLSAEVATIDLTTEGGNIVAVEGSGELVVAIEEGLNISSSAPKSVYFMVLPGVHAAGTLTAEVVAMDNSVATAQLPAVEFKANRYYTQSVSVAVADFVETDPFDVQVSSLKGKVGEPVNFTFSGVADAIDLFTGEEGHNYLYKDTERYIFEKLVLSFNIGFVNGDDINPELLRVKVSQNFSGTYTEEAIHDATWTDITEEFVFPTEVSSSSSVYSEAGSADIVPYLKDASKNCVIGLFFRVTAIPEDEKVSGHGRTQVFVSKFRVNSVAESGDATTLIDNANASNATMIIGDEYANDQEKNYPQFKNNSTLGNYAWFSSMFQPAEHMYGYMITKPVKANNVSLGADTPIVVQSATDNAATSYAYTFAEAGTYEVVVVGYGKTITGEDKEVVKNFTITIE